MSANVDMDRLFLHFIDRLTNTSRFIDLTVLYNAQWMSPVAKASCAITIG
jgi:hypothetical protein